MNKSDQFYRLLCAFEKSGKNIIINSFDSSEGRPASWHASTKKAGVKGLALRNEVHHAWGQTPYKAIVALLQLLEPEDLRKIKKELT